MDTHGLFGGGGIGVRRADVFHDIQKNLVGSHVIDKPFQALFSMRRRVAMTAML